MFEVKKGIPLVVISENLDWIDQSFQNITAREVRTMFATKDLVFSKEEMVLDPTGIATWCPETKKGSWGDQERKAGYYGFKREGYIAFVSQMFVKYID